jgi:predicted ATP-dependent Lon-type protease
MKFTSFMHKKLVDLLDDRRIVVWYDAEGDFKTFVAEFNAPHCEVLSTESSNDEEIRIGVDAVKETLATNYFRHDEANKAQSMVEQKGSISS